MTLPTITRTATGAPAVDFAGAAKPEDLVVDVLEAGDGAPVAEGQNITVHYTGWLWDGAQFDSSWDRGQSISFGIARAARSSMGGWTASWVSPWARSCCSSCRPRRATATATWVRSRRARRSCSWSTCSRPTSGG